jgi:PIN domain nuclease of toxin-antitoxin system
VKLLLDSHILVALTRGEISALSVPIARLLGSSDHETFVSVASLWEIAIKYRLGKLKLDMQPRELPGYCDVLGYTLLSVETAHAIEELIDQPPTREPFDRMLLAQCQVEGLRLVTIDRALVAHPLAWRTP